MTDNSFFLEPDSRLWLILAGISSSEPECSKMREKSQKAQLPMAVLDGYREYDYYWVRDTRRSCGVKKRRSTQQAREISDEPIRVLHLEGGAFWSCDSFTRVGQSQSSVAPTLADNASHTAYFAEISSPFFWCSFSGVQINSEVVRPFILVSRGTMAEPTQPTHCDISVLVCGSMHESRDLSPCSSYSTRHRCSLEVHINEYITLEPMQSLFPPQRQVTDTTCSSTRTTFVKG